MNLAAMLGRALDHAVMALGYPDPKLSYVYNPSKTIWWWMRTWLIGKPHFRINPDVYMDRRYVLPRNRWLNIYLHFYHGPDADPDLHDHPGANVSIVLRGGFTEKVLICDWEGCVAADKIDPGAVHRAGKGMWDYLPGAIAFRRAAKPHTIHAVKPGTVTLFIMFPVERLWGFYRKDGWVSYEAEHRARESRPADYAP